MKSKNIFIHIPKTGGTTINCIMTKSDWQTEPDFNYRHILYDTKRSNSGDIFNPLKNETYSDYHIFTMLRNPVDRLISEYYFIKDRPEFMSLLKPIPKNLIEYAKHKQTGNYMVGFLLGKRMYDEDLVTKNDLQLVLNTINSLNIKVGFFEEYEKSMRYFSSITGIKWPKTIDIKRKTLNRPEINDVSDVIKNSIKKNNALDFELYNHCKAMFNDMDLSGSDSNKISFIGNEYDYIMKYTQRFNLLQVGLKNVSFINNNQIYFKDLNQYLHNKLKQKEGKSYVMIWTDYFIKSCHEAFPGSGLIKKLNTLDSHQEPLEKVKDMCKILDLELRTKAMTYNKPLIFDPSKLNMNLRIKKGLFSILKSKLG
ncbi:sulfotransferase family 2 domain-containing protein [uncultured Psychroserpens sp.]|uniref:sulfotransferase family 2 domain-containing protein n=1 Tax=uncultured Psychroserpens sp. TaxID=255436 RepID=UPI00260BC36C|nr:sulfotransferase family 2 domain-containing protein [uncultured Psychroserpens sp.]